MGYINKNLAVCAAAVAVLAGCKMNMEADLYSSDLQAVAEGQQGITTPATLYLPVTSVDACAEQTAKIVAIMQGIVESFEPKGCERQEINSYMMADIQIPIRDTAGPWEKADAPLFGIIAQHPEDSMDVSVFILMNLEKFRTISERVRDEFYQKLSLDDSAVSIVLNNDERSEISAFVQYAFVNGQPVITTTETARRREQITIELSDVGVAFLAKNGFVMAFTLLGDSR